MADVSKSVMPFFIHINLQERIWSVILSKSVVVENCLSVLKCLIQGKIQGHCEIDNVFSNKVSQPEWLLIGVLTHYLQKFGSRGAVRSSDNRARHGPLVYQPWTQCSGCFFVINNAVALKKRIDHYKTVQDFLSLKMIKNSDPPPSKSNTECAVFPYVKS